MSVPSEKDIDKQPFQRKQEEVTDFFKNLLTGGGKRETIGGNKSNDLSQRENAEKELMRHTSRVL